VEYAQEAVKKGSTAVSLRAAGSGARGGLGVLPGREPGGLRVERAPVRRERRDLREGLETLGRDAQRVVAVPHSGAISAVILVT
jgi:hypothetical protein